jgi:hypothetical protein
MVVVVLLRRKTTVIAGVQVCGIACGTGNFVYPFIFYESKIRKTPEKWNVVSKSSTYFLLEKTRSRNGSKHHTMCC